MEGFIIIFKKRVKCQFFKNFSKIFEKEKSGRFVESLFIVLKGQDASNHFAIDSFLHECLIQKKS